MRLCVRRFSSCVLTLALALTACHDSTGPTLEEVRAKMHWTQQGSDTYTLTITRWCECLPEMIGPVAVLVVSGEVAGRFYAQDVRVVPEQYAELFPPVGGLFAYIDDARQNGMLVDARFDPTLGYPVHIVVGEHPELDGVVTTEVKLTCPGWAPCND